MLGKIQRPCDESMRSKEENSEKIPLRMFAFGRRHDSTSFSTEVSFPDGSVSCDLQNKRLTVIISNQNKQASSEPAGQLSPEHEFRSLFDQLHLFDFSFLQAGSTSTIQLWYPASRITAAYEIADGNAGIILESEFAPTFASSTTNPLDGRPLVQRLSSPLSSPLPPVTRSIYLSFVNETDKFTFMHRATKYLHICRPSVVYLTLTNHELYAAEKVDILTGIMASLPFRLAFEIEKNICSGTITPLDILDPELQPLLAEVAQTYPTASDAIFRFFLLSHLAPNQLLVVLVAANVSERGNSGGLNKTILPHPTTLREIFQLSLDRYLTSVTLSAGQYVPPPEIYQSYHVIITPTTQVLEGPLPDQSNSLLRRFGSYDQFLRVSFQDEERCKLRRDQDVDIKDLLNARYLPILAEGLDIAGRHYEWLGYSMSGLKEHSFWFVNSPVKFQDRDFTADAIRRSLGDFSKIENKPALLAARWAQVFSTSMPSVTLPLEAIRDIEDKKASGGATNAVFTDGVSPISTHLAKAIWKKVKRKSHALASFRTEDILCLRPSQTKFIAEGVRTLDITSSSTRPIACYPQQSIITIAEHHGVPKESFHHLQNAAIDQVQRILTHTDDAVRHVLAIRTWGLLSTSYTIWECDVFHHRLLSKCLVFGANYILRDIKHRAHIFIPGSYTLIGVADEWDCLEEGEVYAHIFDPKRDVDTILSGKILITRSPQIHPGDMQFCQAVGRKSELTHLRNVVVFSCKGSRSLCSKLGGGDLDGDIYNLILDKSLFPPKDDIGVAGEYQGLPHKTTPHEGPCTIRDVAQFVTDYIQTDLLGYISVLFLRIADRHGVDHPHCLLLAEKASQACRLSQGWTSRGVIADDDTRFYKSEKVLGELYRNVPTLSTAIHNADYEVGDKILDAIEDLNLPHYGLEVDMYAVEDDDELLQEMQGVFDLYHRHLMTIAKTHTISKRYDAHLSEAELVSGTIQEKYNDHRKRRESVKAMNLQTQELVNQIHREFLPIQQETNEDEA
ncbi:RNA dependent RNA polymerase-domain-containing protein [Flagelloscypha sp. PMI_526]|nr:RNA dependent RNA polymerase-domain-containing protein [Flagelloscypha sp. PMI_526]